MEPLPEHRDRPHIRPFTPIGVRNEEQKVFVALRDPANLRGDGNSPVVPPEWLPLLALLQGEKSLDELAQDTGAPKEFLVQLVAVLDEAGLLWGPNLEHLEREAMARVTAANAFPLGASTAAGEDPVAASAVIAEFLSKADAPALDGELLGIVAPHLDYARGGATYAAAYKSFGAGAKADRIVILGTNHFGAGDGIVMSRFGFQTPFGIFNADLPVIEALAASLGTRLFKDEIDHLGEHSIQIQLPWIHQIFGNVPIVAALVPNPCVPMLADDGARVSFDEFVPALRAALEGAPGRTLVIASADLSHVGPQFGDETPIGSEIRKQVETYDRSLLAVFLEGDDELFIKKVVHDQNHQRWCSVGNMSAAKLVTGGLPELLEYSQCPTDGEANDNALVTSAALAFVRI